ncbi:uncharacterized protein LOC143852382 [Tasmannia lanceolata]|uniref:uncharacterized protein LOC143852382 n=1 Tax=Tasmannia lanceolata TaxID=3420 RepID=UPI00406453EE
MASFNSLAKILDENKLTGSNYLDWKMNVMLVLTATKVYWVFTTEDPELPGPDAAQADHDRKSKWLEDNEMEKCYILGSIFNVLQQQHIGMAVASDIMLNIKEMFGEQHCTIRLLAIRDLISTKMVEGTSIRDHMIKMMGYLNELDILGAIMDAETQIDIVLFSLCGSFKEFVMTCHMNKMTMSMTELMNQLQIAEDLQKSNKKSAFLAEGNVPSAPKPKGATSHICNILQGFRKIKRLTKGELTLQVGTEATVAVQAVGDYVLTFSGGYLILKDCLYGNSLIVEGTMSHGLYLINALENVSNVENIPSVDIPNLKREGRHWNASFLEEEFIQDASGNDRIALEEQPENPIERYQEVEQVPIKPIPTLRRSSREVRQPDRLVYLGKVNTEDTDPLNYKETMLDIDEGRWMDAMKSEMDSIYSNKVWTLVDPPEGIKPIGCKWIFKRKKAPDGKVETHKARLVANGYSQKAGIDYDETFSQVAMLKSITILLAISTHHDYEIWQMEVKTAFLNGNIQEDIYMIQPEGFEATTEGSQRVCKLKRSIYGLKQAFRSWNIRFDLTAKEFGFCQKVDEACVYKKVSGSAVTFLILCVDNIALIGNDVGMLSSTKL